MTGTPWQRVLVLVSAPLLVVAGGIATASAAPQRAGTGTNCASKAERNRISKGATRRTVRKIVGTAGSTLRRTGREVVRGYPTCRGEKTVVVTFRNGKVASAAVAAVRPVGAQYLCSGWADTLPAPARRYSRARLWAVLHPVNSPRDHRNRRSKRECVRNHSPGPSDTA